MVIDHLHGMISPSWTLFNKGHYIDDMTLEPKLHAHDFSWKISQQFHRFASISLILPQKWVISWSLFKFSFCRFFAPGNCTGNHDNCPSSWASRKIGIIRSFTLQFSQTEITITSKTSKVSRLRPHRIYFVNRSRFWLIWNPSFPMASKSRCPETSVFDRRNFCGVPVIPVSQFRLRVDV